MIKIVYSDSEIAERERQGRFNPFLKRVYKTRLSPATTAAASPAVFMAGI